MACYLIIGGTGSLGRKLINRLLNKENLVVVYSRDEAKHWTIKNELSDHPDIANLRFYVGDIRDPLRVADVIRQVTPTFIIIAAALKHVDTCELSPSESVSTNLLGTQNIINAINNIDDVAKRWLESILFVSTDKACSPVNVYGMCKAISERTVTSQSRTGERKLKYLVVRYGNVLESRGSIIPLFKHQSQHSSFLTVTDPEMTRFVMTLDDSVDLILTTLKHGKSGETWIPKLPAMKVGDLAEIFSEKYGKPIKIIGLRPGEKKHEDLINESESVRCRNDLKPYMSKNYHVIKPAYESGSNNRFTYTSADDVMTKEQLREHLTKLNIIDKPLEEFKGLAIEEIVTNRKE